MLVKATNGVVNYSPKYMLHVFSAYTVGRRWQGSWIGKVPLQLPRQTAGPRLQSRWSRQHHCYGVSRCANFSQDCHSGIHNIYVSFSSGLNIRSPFIKAHDVMEVFFDLLSLSLWLSLWLLLSLALSKGHQLVRVGVMKTIILLR